MPPLPSGVIDAHNHKWPLYFKAEPMGTGYMRTLDVSSIWYIQKDDHRWMNMVERYEREHTLPSPDDLWVVCINDDAYVETNGHRRARLYEQIGFKRVKCHMYRLDYDGMLRRSYLKALSGNRFEMWTYYGPQIGYRYGSVGTHLEPVVGYGFWRVAIRQDQYEHLKEVQGNAMIQANIERDFESAIEHDEQWSNLQVARDMVVSSKPIDRPIYGLEKVWHG